MQSVMTCGSDGSAAGPVAAVLNGAFERVRRPTTRTPTRAVSDQV